MKMKMIFAVALVGLSTAASAQEIVTNGYARVLSVEPIVSSAYRTVPRSTCTTVESHNSTGPVVGAVVGGVVGRNMARDKDAGTVVGAIAGAVIGDHVTEDRGPTQRCTTYHDREYYNRVNGFNVVIEYDGEVRTVRMNRDPGARVPVKVVKRVYVLE